MRHSNYGFERLERLPGYLRVYPSDDKTPQPTAAGLGFLFN
jgi:hypothetical protein